MEEPVHKDHRQVCVGERPCNPGAIESGCVEGPQVVDFDPPDSLLRDHPIVG